MSDEADSLVICAGPANSFAKLGPKARARLERVDGPYAQVSCGTCGGPCMVGKHSRAMLANGRATKIICTDCIVTLAEHYASEDDE